VSSAKGKRRHVEILLWTKRQQSKQEYVFDRGLCECVWLWRGLCGRRYLEETHASAFFFVMSVFANVFAIAAGVTFTKPTTLASVENEETKG